MTHRILLIAFTVALISGCSFPNFLTPYKLDIPQGNQITADQVAKLKPGMTQSQVRFILGTPLLTDPFHANRWDYLFTDARDGKIISKKVFTVTFENEKLISFEGDTFPSAKPAPNASTPAH